VTLRLFGVVPWQSYASAGMLSASELKLIEAYDKQTSEAQLKLFDAHSLDVAALFLSLLERLNKDESIRYVLALISQVREERKKFFFFFFFPFPFLRFLRTT
jgi:V-type H+-transporting ATPase subunit H